MFDPFLYVARKFWNTNTFYNRDVQHYVESHWKFRSRSQGLQREMWIYSTYILIDCPGLNTNMIIISSDVWCWVSNIYSHESKSLCEMVEGPEQNDCNVQEKEIRGLISAGSNMAEPFPFCVCCYQARQKYRHNKCSTTWAYLSK